jgi:hypothetical protein
VAIDDGRSTWLRTHGAHLSTRLPSPETSGTPDRRRQQQAHAATVVLLPPLPPGRELEAAQQLEAAGIRADRQLLTQMHVSFPACCQSHGRPRACRLQRATQLPAAAAG